MLQGTVQLSMLNNVVEFGGKAAMITKGVILVIALYLLYKFATQKTIKITVL